MANLFSIPTGTPFLPALRDRLLDGSLVGPLGPDDLVRATIYLPTRRATRAFAALLSSGAGRATVLPRIVPLGDADDEGQDLGVDLGVALPPAIPPLERRLILTRLIQAWAEAAGRAARDTGNPRVLPDRPADAIGLAADLEGLMDAIETEGARWADLAGLVEAEHSAYFAQTLEFVRIAHEVWPNLLAARGASDPARRRNAALAAETARLAAAPPDGPVIAAGSTGSVPATARLLGAIARLPRGAVVLPGLDLDLDEDGWTAIGGRDDRDGGQHGHPQYLLRRLLTEHLGLDRAAVRTLDGPAAGTGRRRLLSAVMRPAETTDAWASLAPEARAGLAAEGLAGLAILEAADEREEALAVAIAIRETLERPGATAILVTPHRGLAERVAAELERWSIAAFDSAGRGLAETPAGRLARLAADVAATGAAPVAILALLSHPACRLGLPAAERDRAVAALELGILRGPAPRPGFPGLRAALALRRQEPGGRMAEPRRRLGPTDWDAAADLIGSLEAAFAPILEAVGEGGPLDLVLLADRHRAVVSALLDAPEAEEVPADPSEAALLRLFDDLALARVEDGDGHGLHGRLAEYPAFFTALARTAVLAPERAGAHPRVQILGLLEARLLDADRVILGGLDETVWPPSAVTDAFLSRPMRIAMGLTPPERRVGQTAHDFVQALGHADALVTRARKRDGKPTVPSRFLERLRAFVGDGPWEAALGRGGVYRRLAARIDAPNAVRPARRPEPRPGGTAFPRRLSVTEVETLVRDPYAIYARRILRLDPLEAVGVMPGAADRGSLIHDALADFANAVPGPIGSDGAAILARLGEARFAGLAEAYPELHALWWPAFVRFVPAFLAWERTRRRDGLAIHVERSGELAIPLGPDDAVQLRARADRIELGPDGTAAIVDFKTGAVPTDEVVAVGFSPQLTLEAAMLAEGAFRDVPVPSDLAALDYVKIGGRAVLATRRLQPPKKDTRSMAAIVEAHRQGLEATIRRFVSGEAAYVSRPYVQYARRYAPYDHLARVKEWSVLSGEGDAA